MCILHLATSHLNVGDVLVEIRLHDDDLVTGLDEAHEGRQDALVRPRGDDNLGGRIQRAAKERRVGIREGLSQPQSSLCTHPLSTSARTASCRMGSNLGGRILVAIDPRDGLFRSIDNKLWRVVATGGQSISPMQPTAGDSQKPLSKIYDRLVRSGSGLVDDRPYVLPLTSHACSRTYRVRHRSSRLWVWLRLWLRSWSCDIKRSCCCKRMRREPKCPAEEVRR